MAEVSKALGLPLLDWQRFVADVALEVHPDTGQLTYRTVVVTVPRQSGKTSLSLAVSVWRALAFGQSQHIAYCAQSGSEARRKLVDDQVPILNKSPFSSLYDIRLSSGHEAIKWHNGSLHTIGSGTEKASHGQVVDLAFIDEAFSQVDARLETALRPAMVTRSNAQLWIFSTQGTDASLYFNQKVELGRSAAEGLTEGIAYFEWSADPDADASSVEVWKTCMPALRHSGNPDGTVPIESIAADYQSFPLPEFRRSYLNLRDSKRNDPVISAEQWEGCEDVAAKLADPVALAFDVAPDRSTSSIAAAGRAVGTDHIAVEVVEHRQGTAWLVPRLAELITEHKPSAVVADARGPVGSVVADAESAELEITLVNTADATSACGGFFDDATTGKLRHIGQPELTAAVDGASRRMVGDAWLWSRKDSSIDISPLVAATLARWGFLQGDNYDPAEQVW